MIDFPSLTPAVSHQRSAISYLPRGLSGLFSLSGLFGLSCLFGLSGLSSGLLRLVPCAVRYALCAMLLICGLWTVDCGRVLAAEVRLAWDPHTEPDVAGYTIYYGNSSRNYQYYVDVGNQTTFTLTNLSEGQTFYIAVTAHDSQDNESDFSNEIIYQALAPAPSCGYSISPTSQSFGSSSVTGAVNVTTQAGCTWTAASNASWIIRTSNSSLTGNSTVNYSVQQNSSSSPRTGTMSIAGQTFTVTQAGQSQTQFTLSLNKSGNGSGAVTTDPQGSVFAQGTAVKLTATPDSSSTFIGWSGACTGTVNTCSLTMDANKSVTASFSLKTYTISSSAGSNGVISPLGTVTVNQGGSQAFSITPNAGYRIEDVKVDSLSVGAVSSYAFTNMTKNRTIQATFASLSYSLNLTKTGTGTGTITGSPSGTSLAAGTAVTLSATPDSSSTFSGWSGGCSGTSPNCSFTMNANANVTATFTLKSYTISAIAGANGSISPQGSVAVNHGATQSFTVTPNTRYDIADLKADGASVGAAATFTFGTVVANHTIEASFAPSVTPQFPAAILQLNFDEGKGTTALDRSGNNNHGIISGAAYTPDKAVGSYALNFDGIDDKFVVKSNDSLKPSKISVSLWIRHMKDTNSSYGGILQGPNGNGYHNGFRILDYQNKPLLQINFGDGSPKRVLGNPFSMGEWCHLVFTYDGQYIKMYQNGQLIQTIPETRNINWNITNSDFLIGYAQWYFKGAVDEASMYNYALSYQEVKQLFNEKSNELKEILAINFEEGNGNTAFDSSSYKNHGTIYGATYTAGSPDGSYALSFDGIDDHVVVKGYDYLKLSNITVSLWVKHMKDTNSSYGGILQGPNGDGYSNGFRILDYQNKPLVQINFGDGAPKRILGNPFPIGEWCHVVFTYDGQYIKLYQNNVLIQAVHETRNINWTINNSDLYIGWAQWPFMGMVDGVKMHNYVVSSQ